MPVRASVRPREQHALLSWGAAAVLAAATGLAVLGLPPVDLHPVLHHLGIMDPLCGGTRAAMYTMQGEWALAWSYNPLGILAVLASFALLARVGVGMLTGRWVTVQVVSASLRVVVLTIAGVVVLLIALTVRQQFRADLLIALG